MVAVLIPFKAEAEFVNITYVESGVAKAAGAGESILDFLFICVQFTSFNLPSHTRSSS